MIKRHLITLAVLLLSLSASAQPDARANYDESKVPSYELPNPLLFNNGKAVKNRCQWTKKRRSEIIEIFSREMYGHIPPRTEGLHFKLLSEEMVYNGLGKRKTIRIYLDAAEKHSFDVMIHQPIGISKPLPIFVGLNFTGNEGTLDERESSRWPYELILKSGFAVATAWRDSIEPDMKNKTKLDPSMPNDGGVRAWYNSDGNWGAISAWAWGLSRIYDYLETDKDFDCKKVAVIGHSRLGKTALWAGANDTRFSLIVSSCSGCCGAAISRRIFGENFEIINTAFPHWFCREFDKYKGREDIFPADQHWLAALAAPRPLYIASATEDLWADPKGEWITAKMAGDVYALFGKKGLSLDKMPEADSPDNKGYVAYHIRTGKHTITAWDWEQYLEFAARHFK